MRRVIQISISAVILSLILSATVLHADSHEVRYTPSNEAYGACRAQFPYSHLEDCNRDYDFLMLFWLEHMESQQAEPIVYDSCDAAEAAGIPRQQGSIGDEFGFPAELIPSATNGDGDTMVCEKALQPITLNPTSTSIDNLRGLLHAGMTIYTQGPSTELPCSASVTIGEPPSRDRISQYRVFTEPGAYKIPETIEGEHVWQFNTQHCQPWTLMPEN